MIVVWALAFPFIKIGLEELSFINLTIMRFFVVCVAFGFLLLIKPRLFSKLQRRDIIPIFILGFVGVIVYHLGLNYGEQLVSPGAASLIIATIPVYILILAVIFLKEKIGLIKILGIIIALIGVVVISIWGKEGAILEIGYIYAALAVFIAALSGAFYTIAGKKLLSRYNALSLTVYAMLLGSIGLIPLIRISLFKEVASMSLQVWGAILFLGIFSTVIGYFLWYNALELRTASEISVYLYAIPVVATIASYFLFGDQITLMFIFGGILVILGLILVNKRWNQKID
jgi:drug/metabolite transporter (DMT)-like permease